MYRTMKGLFVGWNHTEFVFVFLVTTPWFEAYRENFLQSMPASDHEFLNHYLACILLTEELVLTDIRFQYLVWYFYCEAFA